MEKTLRVKRHIHLYTKKHWFPEKIQRNCRILSDRKKMMIGYIRLMQASHDVTVKQAQLQQAQEDNVALGVAYEKAFDQSAVKAAAQAAGMTKPTTDQIEYIELGGADMAEICRPESTGPLAQAWNWVKNGVDAVVEYFR